MTPDSSFTQIAWAGCLCLALPTLARGPEGVLAQGEEALRVTTRLVVVHVIAQDSKGRPVTDLRREEFTLLDAGRKQPLSLFELESNIRSAECVEELPPNTFSNRWERCLATLGGATVILFDGLNTRLIDQAYAKRQIAKFLNDIGPHDRVALYALGRGPRVLQDFTSDPQALRHALSEYGGDLSPEINSSLVSDADPGIKQLNAWLDELKQNLFDYYARDRALRTVRSLVAIANHLERLPGRKNLIWVSGSFPLWIARKAVLAPEKLASKQESFLVEIERAVRALNNANLAIYPVDARGLMAPAEFSPERSAIAREALRGPERSTLETLQVLAERTGGRAFFNNNDLRAAFQRALEDTRLMYVLGYYPTHGKWDGQFQEIKVQVTRPGVHLWHRRGYFALSHEPSEAWYRRGVLDAAMWSPLDASRLGLTVRVIPTRTGLVELEFQIDPRDIRLEERERVWEGALDILLALFDREDRLLRSASHAAQLRLTPARYEEMSKNNALLLNLRLESAPAATLLRVLVRDFNSGALGSVNIPLAGLLPQ